MCVRLFWVVKINAQTVRPFVVRTVICLRDTNVGVKDQGVAQHDRIQKWEATLRGLTLAVVIVGFQVLYPVRDEMFGWFGVERFWDFGCCVCELDCRHTANLLHDSGRMGICPSVLALGVPASKPTNVRHLVVVPFVLTTFVPR